MLTVLYASLIAWIVPTILVDTNLFAPIRGWLVRRTERVEWGGVLHKLPFHFPEGVTAEQAQSTQITNGGPWLKLAQLVTCQLCTRVWVGFALAAYLGGPLGGWAHIIANGLLYAAGGHFIYELRSRLALVTPE